MNTEHLSPKAAEQLALNDMERIEYIRSPRWIGYPQAQQILAKMEDLLTFPKQSRMPNMLLVGDTNNGKTMLVSHFLRQHPAHDNPHGNGIIAPVVLIQAPPTPDESVSTMLFWIYCMRHINHTTAQIKSSPKFCIYSNTSTPKC